MIRPIRLLLPTLLIVATTVLARAQEGKLVLYTSQPNQDAQQTIDAFKARYPKVDVTFVRDGTPRIVAKLRAEMEAGRAQADVLLVADAVTMEALKQEGRLLPYPEADIASYASGIHDKDRTWFATKLITTGIVYNTRAPFRPQSWEDLLRPEAKGQVVMPSPLASGAALIHAMTLTSNLADGWGFYQKLKASGAIAASGNGDVLRQVAGGEKLFGMIVDFMAIREKQKGAPIAFVFPKEGVSSIGEPAAILKSTQNPVAARAFIAFLLSRDGQEVARQQGYVPAHAQVALPAGFPNRTDIKLMDFDPARALAEAKSDTKRFVDIFSP
jgi:iron(III) transport system substrate-binding protein